MARRLGVAVAALAVVVTGLVAPASAANAAGTTAVRGFALPDTLGAQVVARDTVRVSGPPGRGVKLQVRLGRGTWRTVSAGRTDANRRALVSVTATRSGGQWVWRGRLSGAPWKVATRKASARLAWRVYAPSVRGWTAARSVERVRVTPASGRLFPLGFAAPTQRSSRQVLPGLTLTTFSRGVPGDGYTVTVTVTASRGAAEATARSVRAAGWSARIETLTVPAVADYPAQTYFAVRHGRWGPDGAGKARARADRMARDRLPVWVDFTGDDGTPTSGPYRVTALTLDPRTFGGRCAAGVGASSAAPETTSAMARRLGAVAGVNGGFFDINAPAPFSGDPLGVSVVNGTLVSEAIDGRTALILEGCRARVAEVATTVTVRTSTGSRRVDGVNRVPRSGQVVLYTPHLGVPTPKNGGVDVVLTSDGRVLDVRQPGSTVPAAGVVLHGIGAGEQWLRTHARVGDSVKVSTRVRDLSASTGVRLTPSTHIIGGLVGLVRDGETRINAARNGHASIGMVLNRHPRTLAGTTAKGRLLLVTVDGRRPGTTVGASFVESAELMRWLGATEAVSLDGGGSTTMVVGGRVANTVSGSAERAVGDGLFVLP